MKIFEKKKYPNGKRKIYFLGIKIFSYKKYIKNIPIINCDIYKYNEYLNNGVKFPHLVGIVISRAVSIGKNCVIYQNVTIGAKSHEKGNFNPQNYPKIGNNVIIYAGACVCGTVSIGNNVIIGANAVVIDDVPDNAIVGGIPAKIVGYNNINKDN